MDLTVNILEKFIAGLELTGKVVSVSRSTESTTLTVDKTYHARTGMQLDVDGVKAEILEVEHNKSITVKGALKSALTYKVPNPLYFHGTPMMTNSHINGAKKEDKAPMIYLYEILKERDKRPNSSIVRESNLRLFFLDSANFSDWSTDDHYANRLVGLNCLVDAFIEAARKYTCQFYLYDTDFDRINHVKWGVFTNNKGHTTTLFDVEFTGVEVSFTLPLKNCSK